MRTNKKLFFLPLLSVLIFTACSEPTVVIDDISDAIKSREVEAPYVADSTIRMSDVFEWYKECEGKTSFVVEAENIYGEKEILEYALPYMKAEETPEQEKVSSSKFIFIMDLHLNEAGELTMNGNPITLDEISRTMLMVREKYAQVSRILVSVHPNTMYSEYLKLKNEIHKCLDAVAVEYYEDHYRALTIEQQDKVKSILEVSEVEYMY